MQHDRANLTPILLAFVGLVAFIAFGCPTGPDAAGPVPKPSAGAKARIPGPPQAAGTPEAAPAQAPGRVVLVTIDGWHVRLTDRMPVWQEMAAVGSWSLAAEVPKGATTVISHAALYTGADPSVNGVTRELENANKYTHVHGVKFRWKPFMKVADDGTVTYTVKDTLFTATEAAGYAATAVVQKGKLVGMLRPDGSEAGIRVYGDSGLLKAACADLKDDATRLIVLHIGMPDGAGHEHGWLSDEYYATAPKVDKYLQAIRACIAEADAMGGVQTTLIVTSDHGGTTVDACMRRRGKARCGHGADDADNRRVPWIAVGPGIKPGHEIAASIRLVDTAPTILRILGIPASSIPTLSGVPIDEIFVRP